MIDIDLMAQTCLEELSERLHENDPLGIDFEAFLDQVKKDADKRLKTEAQKLKTETVLSELVKASAEQEHQVIIRSVGTVQHIGNGIATLSGLPMVHLEELVTFPNGVQGMVLNLDRKHVDVILLVSDTGIKGGDVAEATGRRLSIPV